MALQDLTPQLRTRLDRVERIAGVFVGLAILLMAVGFTYYLYHMAERKGWLLAKATYFTFVDSATGLEVGDPVKLMGFDVGEITRIDAMPVDAYGYNVYVEFVVREPYYGYLWTEGSVAKITGADFLGKRMIEVTKGTNGVPTYHFLTLEEIAISTLTNTPEADLPNLLLTRPVTLPNSNQLGDALTPLSAELLSQMIEGGVQQLQLMDRSRPNRHTAILWDTKSKSYRTSTELKKPYWLQRDETPALTARLENLADQVERALPGVLHLTNRLADVLTNAANAARHTDLLLLEAQPVVTNLAALSADFRKGPGALGEWLIPTNLNERLDHTLLAAGSTLATTEARIDLLTRQLQGFLDQLALISSNLNLQLAANTNLISQVASLVTNTDHLVQGLPRHWLFRSAFKEKPPKPATAPPRSTLDPRRN